MPNKHSAPSKAMQIVVINKSGNTGKTTLARHLLGPLFPDAYRIRMESICATGADVADMHVKNKSVTEIAKKLFTADGSVIVDVGASNAESLLSGLRFYADVPVDVDLWLLPCARHGKAQLETINTVRDLIAMGVSVSKIVVIKNMIEPEDVCLGNFEFDTLANGAQELGIHLLETPVLNLRIYDEIFDKPGTLDELCAHPTYISQKEAHQALENLKAVRSELFCTVLEPVDA